MSDSKNMINNSNDIISTLPPHGLTGHADMTNSHLLAPAVVNGARILVAENNFSDQLTAAKLLKNTGAILSIANNGQEAIDLLAKGDFDCVLMDVQMPVMDGLEATRLIRANHDLARLPVIAMMANTSGDNRYNCLAAGINDFIEKPFKPHVFYNVIAKWLTTAPYDAAACNKGATLIDLSVLAELFGGNKQKMREFALKFLASMRLEMTKLEAALRRNDLTALSALGHHISGPSGLVGAKEFAGLCRTLEIDCKDNEDLEQIQDIVNRMNQMLESINQQVNKELA